MAIKYRSAGPWGAGEGADLSAADIDGNFYDHEGRIVVLEASVETARGITATVQNGALLTVYYSDATTDVWELPTSAWSARGEWAAATAYAANDLVSVNGLGLYLVLQTHTSDTAFDATEFNSDGLFYELLFADNRNAGVIANAAATLVPTIAYSGYYVRCTNGGGCIVTFPPGVFQPRDEVHFRQCASGPVEIRAGAGVTINAMFGFERETSGLGAVCTVKCIGTNEFDLFGMLAEERSA